MDPVVTGAIASILYLGIAAYLALHLRSGEQAKKSVLLAPGAVALLLHLNSIYGIIITSEGLQFGLFKIGSMFGWVIAALTITTSLYRPIENLIIVAYPIAAAALWSSILVPTSAIIINPTPSIVTHIVISILAYSILAIAVGQAMLLATQNYQLKHKHTHGILEILPPLQTMETVLFEMLWLGIALLSVSIVTGIIFLDDIVAQHMIHKTVLSISAWVIFAVLLGGRHFLGWRGVVATRWTLGGFFLLLLAYFGSKLVLEVLLA